MRADKDKLIEAMERAISNEDDFMKSNADVDCVFVELTENLETALVEASGCMPFTATARVQIPLEMILYFYKIQTLKPETFRIQEFFYLLLNTFKKGIINKFK